MVSGVGAEVEVDTETGRVNIAKLINVIDCGKVLNPKIVETQISGAALMHLGFTMFEKMQHLARHQDDLRKRMLREPRGYPAANCNLVLPPCRPDADAGFVIMEQVEYPPMSGTNTIAVTTVLLETGMIPMVEPVTELTLESPAGLIRVRAE